MNIVFVGAGSVFGYHGEQFARRAPEGSKLFIVEPNDEVAAQAYDKYKRIYLEEAVEVADLAFIFTPSYVRWKVCKPFIDKKIPIVIEKPLTINWDEMLLFEEAAKSSWICPIVNIRMIPKIGKMIKDNPNPKSIISWKNRDLDNDYYTGWHGKYATDGGVLAQQGFHCLDLVCFIGGEVESVEAKGSNKLHKIECEDTATVHINFKNGAKGYVDCTTAKGDRKAGLNIDGKVTEGFQFADNSKPGHTALAEKIYKALANNEPPPITVESVIPSIKCLHACYTSMAKDGEIVKVGKPDKRLGQCLQKQE